MTTSDKTGSGDASDAARSAPTPKKGRTKPKAPRSSAAASAAAKAEEAPDREGVVEALETGLSEALPGVEVLDRGLEFDDGVRADLAAVDPVGRLVLVVVAHAEPDRAVLDALDVLRQARANTALVVRHIGSRRIDPGLEPRIVVVDPADDERVAERLGALAGAGIDVFGVRTLRSAAGECSYLVAKGDTRQPVAGARGVQEFLDALPLPLQDIGRELTARMNRLDDDLLAATDGSAVVWRWKGEVLARLECVGDQLRASVAPDHRPAPVREATDLDEVVDGALARLVAELHRRPAEAGDDDLAGGGLDPDEPLLTPDEIAAFRD